MRSAHTFSDRLAYATEFSHAFQIVCAYNRIIVRGQSMAVALLFSAGGAMESY